MDRVLLAFIVIGLPMIMIFGYPMLRRWLDFRERQLEMEAKFAAEQAARYAASNERLEQRVRVLERIITDKGVVVAEEIDKLRDEPLN
jgi:hypothetical protein